MVMPTLTGFPPGCAAAATYTSGRRAAEWPIADANPGTFYPAMSNIDFESVT
jgi:hypothetical protein